MKYAAGIVATAMVLGSAAPSLAQKRPLSVNDIYNLKDVRDPQRSPDGKWVAYVVSRAMKDTDKNDTDIWMASWDGTQEIQVTSSPDGESQPRWSPDNKYLSFVSSRQGAKDGQLWLMNRVGGEAVKVSDVKGGVSSYAWAPDAHGTGEEAWKKVFGDCTARYATTDENAALPSYANPAPAGSLVTWRRPGSGFRRNSGRAIG